MENRKNIDNIRKISGKRELGIVESLLYIIILQVFKC